MKRALITGITGQDGSYLAELLLSKGYKVYGMIRRTHAPNFDNIAGILDRVMIADGDLLDQSSLIKILSDVWPDEVYNLAAQSHVGLSFSQPHATAQITGIGVLRLLEAIRITGCPARFYQASTSELFGNAATALQYEDTPFVPRSPYGCAKLYAHHMVQNYREAYDLFACSGILFNHESPRRGLDFVTRKITDGLARIKAGLADSIELGNMTARRDWGYAPEYVEAMWLMLQQKEPKDYVIATGEMHSVSEFLALAAIEADLPHDIVRQGALRPSDVFSLCGDAWRARHDLGWNPHTTFPELVHIMMREDLKRYGICTTLETKESPIPEEKLVEG
jgi:GDPmannose 4,6-dehydratase